MHQLFPFSDYWWLYAGFTGGVLGLLAIDLGVFTACFAVMSFCDDPILHNQNGSYRWIGTRSSGRLAGFL